MELNLRRLRVLREVAEHGGVTAAAHATGSSSSAVSQQMAALERDVGGAVLERQGRHVVLTDLGQVVLKHAEIMLAAEQAALAETEDARNSLAVDLMVGVFSTVAAGLMPLVADDLARRHPQIRVRTREVDPDEVLLDLRHGHLDVGFLIDYPAATEPWPRGVTIVPLDDDTLQVAAPTGLFDRRVLDLADLADQEWVMSGPGTYYGRAVRAACLAAGFDIHITHQVDEQATALAMVAAGMGITLVSDLGRSFLPTTGADVIPLARPLRRHLLIGHERAAASRPAVRAFVDAARRAALRRRRTSRTAATPTRSAGDHVPVPTSPSASASAARRDNRVVPRS